MACIIDKITHLLLSTTMIDPWSSSNLSPTLIHHSRVMPNRKSPRINRAWSSQTYKHDKPIITNNQAWLTKIQAWSTHNQARWSPIISFYSHSQAYGFPQARSTTAMHQSRGARSKAWPTTVEECSIYGWPSKLMDWKSCGCLMLNRGWTWLIGKMASDS